MQIIGFNIMVILTSITVFLLVIMIEFITRSFIFIKAKEKWYKCLFPFYSGYTFYVVAGEKRVFFVALPFMIVFVCAVLAESVNLSYYVDPFIKVITGFAFLVTFAIVAAFSVARQVMLAKAFGKNAAFAVGLVVLRPIFMLILAFGKSEYRILPKVVQ